MQVSYDDMFGKLPEADGEPKEETPKVESTEEEKETPSDSPTEDNEDEESPSHQGEESDNEESDNTDDEDKPFHKNPRWKKMHRENRASRKTISDLEDRLKNLETGTPQAESFDLSQEEIELFGLSQSDPTTMKLYKDWRKKDREKLASTLKSEILSELKGADSQRKAKADEQSDWVDEELDMLKEAGAKFNKNKLLKLVEDYRPQDEDGNIDFVKAYKLYRKFYPKSKKDVSGKKDVAAKSSGKDSNAVESDVYVSAV